MAVREADTTLIPQAQDWLVRWGLGAQEISVTPYILPHHEFTPLKPGMLLDLFKGKLTGVLSGFEPYPAAVPASISFPQVKGFDKALAAFERAFFPQDALLAAQAVKANHPEFLYDSVCASIMYQGLWNEGDKMTRGLKYEAAVGRVPHEIREPDDETARSLSEVRKWGWPFYGSLLPTELLIEAIHASVNPETGFEKELLLKRIERRGGVNRKPKGQTTVGEGLFSAAYRIDEWTKENNLGLIRSYSSHPLSSLSQSWTDSWNRPVDNDGRLLKGNFYPLEIQVLGYDGLIKTAHILDEVAKMPEEEIRAMFPHVFGQNRANAEVVFSAAKRLRGRANLLKDAIISRFTFRDEKETITGFAPYVYYDKDGNPVKSNLETSDIIWLLGSDFLKDIDSDGTVLQQLLQTIFDPEGIMGTYGPRTTSKRSPAYHPLFYHGGTKWSFITNRLANGLWKEGYYGLAWQMHMANWLLFKKTGLAPECISGDDSYEPQINLTKVSYRDSDTGMVRSIFPPAQPLQLWTVASETQAAELIEALDSGVPLPLTALDERKKTVEDELLERMKSAGMFIEQNDKGEYDFRPKNGQETHRVT